MESLKISNESVASRGAEERMSTDTRGMSLDDRMKEYYESPWLLRFPMRTPLIIRVDGKAFHTLTRGMEKPFDARFMLMMEHVATTLCHEIQGAQLAYFQSDEISILVHNYKRFASQGWFGNEIQKICSVSAGVASAVATLFLQRTAVFDSRAFILPEAEVVNYFIWRQQDATRNSIQSVAQSMYPHKDLHGRDSGELQEMIYQKGTNWNDLPVRQKRGACIRRSGVEITSIGPSIARPSFVNHTEIPIFSEHREYIQDLLAVEEE